MKSCQLCVVLRTWQVTPSDLFLTLGMYLWQGTTCCRSWKQWYGSLFQELLHTLLRTCLSKKIIIHSIAYSISYDVCHVLGNTTANHNGVGGSLLPKPTVVTWQSCENFLSRLVRKVHCCLIFHVNKKIIKINKKHLEEREKLGQHLVFRLSITWFDRFFAEKQMPTSIPVPYHIFHPAAKHRCM